MRYLALALIALTASIHGFDDSYAEFIDSYGEIKKGESKVMSITVENFSEEVEDYEGNVILDVYADWCSPCKKMKPIFEALSIEYPEIKFAKINSDEAKEIVKRYKVRGIPCLIFFTEGKEVGRILGLTDAKSIKEKIKDVFVSHPDAQATGPIPLG